MTGPGQMPAEDFNRLEWAGFFKTQVGAHPFVNQIFQVLTRNGFDAWVVGGALRNAALGKTPKDVDILTNASPGDLMALFSAYGARMAGRTFAVCLVNGMEISVCRTGRDFPKGDLAHRDFTFNAMAWHPVSGQFLDLFGGLADLSQRRVRFTVDPEKRIAEDPLRMIRACRFASAISGRLSGDTAAAIRRHAVLLSSGAFGERIHVEILKAMTDKRPSLFFDNLHDTGLLERIFPCLDRCHSLDGGPHHGETVYAHCLLTGDALSARRPLLRLAGFLHDVGKFSAWIETENGVSFPGHETHTQDLEADLLNLRFPAAQIRYILSLVRVHMRPLTPGTTPKAARRILALLAAHQVSWQDFLRLRIADKRANRAKAPYTLTDIRCRLAILLDEMNRDTAVSVPDLKISGHDVMAVLNLEPGPRVGEILAGLLDRVIDDPELNTPDQLKKLVKAYERVSR